MLVLDACSDASPASPFAGVGATAGSIVAPKPQTAKAAMEGVLSGQLRRLSRVCFFHRRVSKCWIH